MAQNPFDQLSKQYLEEFLTPIGTVQRQYEIPGEAKFVDVWFVPNSEVSQVADLGLLGQIVQTPCLLEPYRNVPTRTEVRVSVMKLIWIQEDERRKAQPNTLNEDTLPRLWILAATTSNPLLQEASGLIKANWMPGIYFLADIFKTAIVAIDQLPETEETLWLRILGRDSTQERAIREVLALPSTHPRRNSILRLLANWKVRIEVNQAENLSGQETLMAFSEAFLEWEQTTQQRAEQSLILRLLTRKVGEISEAARSQIQALSIADLEALGEALLDFSDLTDLENWLAAHS
jgi:hypothetical protein